MTVWALLKYLRAFGFEVQLIALRDKSDYLFSDATYQRLSKLLNGNIHIVTGRTSRRSSIFANPTEFCSFDSSVHDAVESAVNKFSPSLIIAYHWDSISLIQTIKEIPKLGLVGDPINAPAYRMLKYSILNAETSAKLVKRLFKSCILIYYNILSLALMQRLLRSCDFRGSFQMREIKTYQLLGIKDVKYFSTPLVDNSTSKSIAKANGNSLSVLKVLLGPSNINSTVTSSGLDFFARKVFPLLVRMNCHTHFEFRIVGEGQLSKSLASICECYSNVKFVGRVAPPDAEFHNADVQLSLTPFILGNRVRLIAGMMHSLCLIIHRCEAENSPELISNYNCLDGTSASDICKHLMAVYQSPLTLRRLQANARKTYDRFNRPDIAAAKIISCTQVIS